MFDGVPADQFHQFIASSRTSLPIPHSFPLHGSSPTFPSTFDPYPSHQTLQSHLLHQLHHQSPPLNKDEEKETENSIGSTNSERIEPWSNDEVLSLLRIRSSMENWFPDLTWEHVSRKLAEFGFKRSAEKCKEKFEEETRNFNSISFDKNRFLSELEELYHGEKTQGRGKPNEEDKMGQSVEEDPRNVIVVESEEVVNKSTKTKRRKRGEKFEMFKGFCIDVVNKMMAQQEEMHNKLLEDMVNRDEQQIAKEEAWKKQEMERINKEIEIREHELAIAGDRQATIIEFLKKFTYNSAENKSLGILSLRYEDLLKVSSSLSSLASSAETPPPSNPSSTLATNIHKQTYTSTLELASQNHNSSNVQKKPSAFSPSSAEKAQKNPNSGTNEGEDIGKRWPKDEVLALINMRCSLYSNKDQDKEEGAKGSLWERISQGMLELGYKRSAKRCKEKWENINKYFRKTKDVNKKRSVDSRTCPYFHQLSSLYNQGTLVAAVEGAENGSALTKINTASPETSVRSTDQLVVDGGNNTIQVPAFNFEF